MKIVIRSLDAQSAAIQAPAPSRRESGEARVAEPPAHVDSRPSGDIATVSPAALARAAAPVDVNKVEQLRSELATHGLSPDPTNIATMMLAEPSGDGR